MSARQPFPLCSRVAPPPCRADPQSCPKKNNATFWREGGIFHHSRETNLPPGPAFLAVGQHPRRPLPGNGGQPLRAPPVPAARGEGSAGTRRDRRALGHPVPPCSLASAPGWKQLNSFIVIIVIIVTIVTLPTTPLADCSVRNRHPLRPRRGGKPIRETRGTAREPMPSPDRRFQRFRSTRAGIFIKSSMQEGGRERKSLAKERDLLLFH